MERKWREGLGLQKQRKKPPRWKGSGTTKTPRFCDRIKVALGPAMDAAERYELIPRAETTRNNKESTERKISQLLNSKTVLRMQPLEPHKERRTHTTEIASHKKAKRTCYPHKMDEKSFLNPDSPCCCFWGIWCGLDRSIDGTTVNR